MEFLSYAASEVMAGGLTGGMDFFVLQISCVGGRKQRKKVRFVYLKANFQNLLTYSHKYTHI